MDTNIDPPNEHLIAPQCICIDDGVTKTLVSNCPVHQAMARVNAVQDPEGMEYRGVPITEPVADSGTLYALNPNELIPPKSEQQTPSPSQEDIRPIETTPIETPKAPVGRPSKYSEQYCEMLTEHMEKGLSFDSFAAVIDVDRDTLYEWLKVHEEFSDTYNKAKVKNLLFWEKLGVQGTAGKLPGFNAATYALNMANRHRWFSARNDVTSGDEKIDTRTVIMMPQKLSESNDPHAQETE